MQFSILIPHYRTGKVCAYAISQLLKFKGIHDIEIIVIDNNAGDGSANYLTPFAKDITYLEYPKDKIQSHGVAFDFAIENGLVSNEHVITIESDSFPTKDNWLDSYERLINDAYDCAGSLLKLSGGTYIHPAGAIYKKSVWQEAKEYVDNIAYDYFPNMAAKEGFDCHLMIRKDWVERVLNEPEDFIELGKGYKGLSPEDILAKRDYYSPIGDGVFHNGMGKLQESIKNFGNRDTNSGKVDVMFDDKSALVFRIGMEPGQFITNYQIASNKKIALIPIEIKWMKNRGGQQQEYTLMSNGFKHLWSVSAYHESANPEFQDIVTFKSKVVDDLYNSLPSNQKI